MSARCICNSNYKPGDRVSIFDFCLLCWGTGTRLTTGLDEPLTPMLYEDNKRRRPADA